VRERFGLTEVVLVGDRGMITKSRIAGADLLTPAADILPTRRHTTAQHSGARPTTELAQNLGPCSTFAHEALHPVTASSCFPNLRSHRARSAVLGAGVAY
jgi:hypothetical protein